METATVVQIILTVIGSGALFSFFQFLIQRRDKKEEDTTQKQLIKLKNEIMTDVYEREKNNQIRSEISQKAIQELTDLQERSFNQLIETIDQLKESDRRITKDIERIANGQDNMNKALVGMIHDQIVSTTDLISRRGAITLKEKTSLQNIYVPYRNMGGNSDAKTGYEYVMTLSVIPEEEAIQRDKEEKARQFKDVFATELNMEFKKQFGTQIADALNDIKIDTSDLSNNFEKMVADSLNHIRATIKSREENEY